MVDPGPLPVNESAILAAMPNSLPSLGTYAYAQMEDQLMVPSKTAARTALNRPFPGGTLLMFLQGALAIGLLQCLRLGTHAWADERSFLGRHERPSRATQGVSTSPAQPAARIQGEASRAASQPRHAPARVAQRPQPAAVERWVSDYDAQVFAGAPLTQPALLRNYGALEPAAGDRPDLAPQQSPTAAAGSPADDDAAPIDTTLYGGYYNPSFVGYGHQAAFAGRQPSYGQSANQAAFGGRYASYGGFGYGGFPVGSTNYPPWLYRPRYFYPYRNYPPRTGFSVYNPQFFYNNTWYGRYANPFWSGYGGFAFPYHFGGLGPAAASNGGYRGFGSGYGGPGGYGAYRGPGGLGGPGGYGGFGASYGGRAGGYGFGGFGFPYRYGVFGYPYPSLARSVHSYLPSFAYFMYPGMGGLYVPPGFWGFPGYYGYAGYGLPVGSLGGGGFYW
jgi:hypothetical protein